ncbi:nucleotide exchange factor GrpE [Lutibaculum baratangense]|uniref:Protein GrpE n=1 Tax=Lutibaculum baratangense AMV1 TaxID=631454 RepID=V4R1Z4_9HYPH|nr:nucleotide exchange factor GrpE [Lutibaculum baratangense]ESR25942.1 Heat shock protein GrpE [Lutibaculum baratangense AMV1]
MNEQKDPANENESVSPEAERVIEQDSGQAAESELTEPSAEEKLLVENAELKDRMLRIAAEMDNLRKRTEREVKDARAYAVTGFARDMLGVADNMRRAIEAVPEEERQTVASLLEGVEMTERELLKTLERHGVKKLEPQGEKFDPNVHQAMFEVEDASVPHGTVVQVLQSGYVISDRVLRPAMVGVSKGGPKGGASAGRSEETAEQNGGPTIDRRA